MVLSFGPVTGTVSPPDRHAPVMADGDDAATTAGSDDASGSASASRRDTWSAPGTGAGPLERQVAAALRRESCSLAVAESCTGGLVASLLTDVPGASDYLSRGFVVYTPTAKREVLAVSRETLDEHGPVSDRAARELAAGARDVAAADWAVSTTGYAGPEGGASGRPVGTAFVGVAHAAPWGSGGSFVRAARVEFDGDRHAVKERVARAALGELLAALDRDADADAR
jgi:nicotinamide-nucleotide amidase